MGSIFENLVSNHYKYYQSSINTRRFAYEEILKYILDLEKTERFTVEKAGKSFQGREIFCIHWGKGAKHILMWSQMHGDESTATRALLDIWNFLSTPEQSDHKDLVEEWASKVTLHFIPILNPDGTDRWQRRTIQGIDMNRDALSLQTPEARILKSLCDSIKPAFGFNLHDQSIYYAAGDTGKPAMISFLAPAFNSSKDINATRKSSMQLIGHLNTELSRNYAGFMAKYDDTFNPRAFGDNIQKWGISTILIESGGYYDDPEKEFIRKINFGLILEAVHSISSETYKAVSVKEYEKIPFNKKEHFFDLILRNANLKRNGKVFKADVAINREENDYNNHRNFYYRGVIVDIGDLSTYCGYEEIDLKGVELQPGREYPYRFKSLEEAIKADMKSILSNGYTSVIIKEDSQDDGFTNLPVNIRDKEYGQANEIEIEGLANLLAVKDGETKWTVVNGYLFNPETEDLGIKNSLKLRN